MISGKVQPFHLFIAIGLMMAAMGLYLSHDPEPGSAAPINPLESHASGTAVPQAPLESSQEWMKPETRAFTEEQLAENARRRASESSLSAMAATVIEIRTPTALQPFDPNELGLTPAQMQEVVAVGADFLAALDGAGGDANEPQTAHRWNEAAATADGRLRAALGATLADQIQLQVAQAAHQKSLATKK